MRGKQDHSRQHGLRRRQTASELALWQQLRGRRLHGWKFRRQHRIGPYFVDFICLQARLIVELDGSQHMQQIEYDHDRTRFLEKQGYRVLRFWNDAIFLQANEMLEQIASALKTPHPPCGHLLPACGEKE